MMEMLFEIIFNRLLFVQTNDSLEFYNNMNQQINRVKEMNEEYNSLSNNNLHYWIDLGAILVFIILLAITIYFLIKRRKVNGTKE